MSIYSGPNIMQIIFKIICGTPKWVWIVFCYVLFIGIKAIRTRIVYITKLFIVPVILTGVKYKMFLNATISIWSCYCLCLLISTLLSFKFAKNKGSEFIRGELRVRVQGSYSILIILMAFFLVKYIFGYLYATNYDIYSQIMILEIGVSGLFSGYFFWKALNYLHCYIRTL